MTPIPELLAPAGGWDAGLAAVRGGADAVYLGLSAFSARAEAENFTPERLARFVDFAHRADPPRRVYVAVNTLVRPNELPAALATLADAAEAGADAAILQDAGLAALAARHFPELARHASTQLAIHNAEGVRTAAEWGFSRVTLAREMTRTEIRRAAEAGRSCGVAVEAFVHGALCYGYSGLCLAGGVLKGRSGNRGRCVYSCRVRCVAGEGAEGVGDGHAFSLKDMGRVDDVAALADAGVAGLKIEGRKKSPLYVAAATALYRYVLDETARGRTPDPSRVAAMAGDVRTVFARPWTPFFLDGDERADVADPEVVGHRGAPCGTVVRVRRARGKAARGAGVEFAATRALERRDGLQYDVPGEARPYGFAVDEVRLVRAGYDERVYATPAGAVVWVALPADAPAPPPGSPVYCASSQAVKRAHAAASAPVREEAYRVRFPLSLAVRLDAQSVTVDARLAAAARDGGESGDPVFPAEDRGGVGPAATLSFAMTFPEPAQPARDPVKTGEAARQAFSRLGDTRLRLAGWRFDNPGAFFLPPARWNAIRRDVADRAERLLAERREARLGDAGRDAGGVPEIPATGAMARPAAAPPAPVAEARPRWSVYVDDLASLAAFEREDWDGVDEVVVAVRASGTGAAFAPPGDEASFVRRVGDFAARADAENGAGWARRAMRFALPVLMRDRFRDAVRARFDRLRREGWSRWLLANAWAFDWFDGASDGEASGGNPADLAGDWPLYAPNRAALEFWRARGLSRVTLSPEESPAQWAALAAGRRTAPPAWAVVYGDAPLFLSAACAHRTLARAAPGGCPWRRGGGCAAAPMPLRMADGTDILVVPQGCGSVVLAARTASLAGRLDELARAGLRDWRVDFRWRPYPPDRARAVWRTLRRSATRTGSRAKEARHDDAAG